MSNAAPTTIEDGVVVIFHYQLTVDGEVVDNSFGEEPMASLQGHNNIVPGLEKALAGRTPGDEFEVAVEAAEGYGEKGGPGPQAIDRAAFPEEVEIEVGMPFFAEGPDGGHMTLWVTSVEPDTVLMDRNHPLAGKTLNFKVEIVSLRAANPGELEHGHPHGIDGTHHHHH